MKREISCPYCGSTNIRALSSEKGDKYRCRNCGWLFECDTEAFENIRRQVSRILEGTDKDHPLECDITVGEDIACGISSLLLPCIDKCYLQEDTGLLWFHMADEIPDTWNEFDFFSMDDVRNILYELQHR